ncbi:MAG: Fic family protein [Rhodocyclales bacterium]|nr:Fic family protein [Rhodocyclales bacterium]
MDVLDRVIDVVAGLRGEQLASGGLPGKFDLAHLCAIHRVLFQDVFAWAGQLRTVDTEKQGQDFVPAAEIPEALRQIHADLEAERFLCGLGIDEFADRLAEYYYRIYAVHAFRDGNSRCLRHFCTALAAAAGYRLDFAALERIALYSASRHRYFNGDGGPLRDHLRRIAAPA